MEPTKKEIQEKLIEMGAAPKLVKMPAVVERIAKLKVGLDKLDVDKDGNILFAKGKTNNMFRLNQDDTATFLSDDSGSEYIKDEAYVAKIIQIDKYGFETRSGEGYSHLDINEGAGYYERRPGGIVHREDSYIAVTVQDANWSEDFDDYADWDIKSQHEYESYADYKKESPEAFRQYKEARDRLSMAYLIAHYPDTKEWLIQRGMLEGPDIDKQIAEAIRGLANNNERTEFKNKTHEVDSGLGFLDMISEPLPQEELDRRAELNKQEVAHLREIADSYEQGIQPEPLKYTEQESIANRMGYFTRRSEELEEKNHEALDRLILLRTFAQRCTRIPFVGKKISATLIDQSMALYSGEMIDDSPKTDLDGVYEKYITIKGVSKQYRGAYTALRSCIVDDCGKFPFIGKRLIKELEKFQKETKEKDSDDLQIDE